MAQITQSYAGVFGTILIISFIVPALMVLMRERVIKRIPLFRGATVNSTIFSFVTSLYAFFLGFSMVTLWTAYQNTRTEVALEANGIYSAYQLSYSLEKTEPLRQALREYVTNVIEVEWPYMNATDTLSKETDQRWRTVWDTLMRLRPADKADSTLFATVAAAVIEATKHRETRALLISGNLYPPVWVILWFGAFAIMIGLLFINLEAEIVQAIIESVTVFLVLSCIYFIADLDTPFSGTIQVEAGAFITLQKAIQNIPLGP